SRAARVTRSSRENLAQRSVRSEMYLTFYQWSPPYGEKLIETVKCGGHPHERCGSLGRLKLPQGMRFIVAQCEAALRAENVLSLQLQLQQPLCIPSCFCILS